MRRLIRKRAEWNEDPADRLCGRPNGFDACRLNTAHEGPHEGRWWRWREGEYERERVR